jgi:hypothetical protein
VAGKDGINRLEINTQTKKRNDKTTGIVLLIQKCPKGKTAMDDDSHHPYIIQH